MKLAATMLRKIIAEEVQKVVAENAKALPASIPDPEELKMAMKDTYGRARAYRAVPGNPNMVLVKDMEIPGQFWPWEYEAFGPYRGWNEGDGPVDSSGRPV